MADHTRKKAKLLHEDVSEEVSQPRREGASDEEDTESEAYDQELLRSIEKLQEVQDELEKVNEEASDRVLEVEQEFNEKRRPVYKRRNEIINSIPDFWLTAFLSHPSLDSFIRPEDQEVFKYLTELQVEDFKDVKSGYAIHFLFKSNPFFEDEKLTKSFSYSEDGTLTVKGTKPKWKEGKEPSSIVSVNGQKKRPRPVESFFKWFEKEVDDDDDPLADGDYIAELIKDDLWPNPLKYFNSDNDNDGDEEDDELEEGEEQEEEEDDDDDDDDDNDDDNLGGEGEEEGGQDEEDGDDEEEEEEEEEEEDEHEKEVEEEGEEEDDDEDEGGGEEDD